MSVLIKGLKMPQSCYMCDMQELSGVVGCEHAYDTSNSEWGRALNCPLVEIPDHGDLIDRDALKGKAEFVCDAFTGIGDYAIWGYDFLHAPVVIPAERSEASLCICDNCDQRNDKGCSVCKYIINEGSEDGEN